MSVNKYIDGKLVKVTGGPGDASEVYYKNTTSGLDANDVKSAIDELASEKIDASHIMTSLETCTASTNNKDVAGAAAIKTLQENFQDGVESCYNAVLSKGTTPNSKSLADVIAGIQAITVGNNGANGTLTLKGSVSTSAQWATSSGSTSSSGGTSAIEGTVVLEDGVVKSYKMSGSAPEQTSGWQTLSACWADGSFTLTGATWTPSDTNIAWSNLSVNCNAIRTGTENFAIEAGKRGILVAVCMHSQGTGYDCSFGGGGSLIYSTSGTSFNYISLSYSVYVYYLNNSAGSSTGYITGSPSSSNGETTAFIELLFS